MSIVGKRVCAAVVLALSALHGGPGVTQSAAQSALAGSPPSLQASKYLAFIQAPDVHSGDTTRRFPRGSQLVRIRLDASGVPQGEPIPLTPGLFAAADPQISSDGRNVLFAAQSDRSAAWQIFQVPSEGGIAQQVTHCPANCVHPVYLPDDQIAYNTQSSGPVKVLEVEVSRGDGAEPHAITFGPGKFQIETALRSGRLLLTAEWPLVSSSDLHQPLALYVMDPDGSGLALLRQHDALHPRRGSAIELTDGTVAFVRQDTGQLAEVRPGALHATPIASSHSRYASVQELSDGWWIASRRATGQQSDLYRVPHNPLGRTQLLYRGGHTSSLQAVPIAPHPEVQGYRSILHPERTSGRLICLDAYASKDVATGRLSSHIARLRVVTRSQSGEQVLGEAPVELDGSFYATVPADLPVRLILIGSKGEILKQQRSWMWVRRGEDRGCFGCHESQAQAPENRSPMTLQRMDTPTLLITKARTTLSLGKAVRR